MPDATGIYQRIAPDGSISVNTAGVELKPRLPTETPELTPNKQVRWVDDSAGLVAYVDDQYDPTNGNLLTLRSLSTLGGILARAGNTQRALLNADGTSDWLLRGNIKVYAMWGQSETWQIAATNFAFPYHLDDGAGRNMLVNIVPTTNVYFIAIASVTWAAMGAAWGTADWGLWFNPVLANLPALGTAGGTGSFDKVNTETTVHTTAGPWGGTVMHIGGIGAGASTNIGLAVFGVSNANVQFYRGYGYLRLFVLTIPMSNTYV